MTAAHLGPPAWLLTLYRLALGAFPPRQRRRYGHDLVECFEDLYRNARRVGRRAAVAITVRAFADVPRSAVRMWFADAAPRRGWGRWPSFESLLQDVSYGIRGLRRTPGLAALAVLSLGLGVGANTTMFSAVAGVVWRPMPVPQPDRLVRVFSHRQDFGEMSYANFRDLRDESGAVFTGMFAHSLNAFSLDAGTGSEVVFGELVSASYFEVLSLGAEIGSLFGAATADDPGSEVIGVISHTLWQQQFGADSAVVGSVVSVNGVPVTVIGVAPPEFQGTKFGLGMDLWIPIRPWGRVSGWGAWEERRGNRWLEAVARLAPAVTMESAQEAVRITAARLADQYPRTNRGATFALFPGDTVVPHDGGLNIASFIGWLAIAASALVLLVACANVASLLYARAVARQRELGIRLAVGAGRARLVRQLLTESALLAIGGGVVGTTAAFWTVGFIRSFLPPIPYRFAIDLTPDVRVLLVAAAVSLGSTLIFGLMPALRASRVDVASTLRAVDRPNRSGRLRGLNAVVVTMVAFSFVALVLTTLFSRSLAQVRNVDPGFRTDNRLVASIDVSLANYAADRVSGYYDQLTERVRGLPGVVDVAVGSTLPLGDRRNTSRVYADDRDYDVDDPGISVWVSRVDSAYFSTMGMGLIAGRAFTAEDRVDTRPAVVVNETLANRLWPDGEAVGRRLRYSRTRGDEALTVVGVVPDGRYYSINETPRPAMYLAFAQAASASAYLIVEAAGDPRGLVPAVREQVRALDPAVPMFDVKTMEAHLSGSMWLFRMGDSIGGVLGLLALGLAAAGLYGVMTFTVRQRDREMGLRLALGARMRNVVALVMTRGILLSGIGIGIGAAVAMAIGGVLESVLFGVAPSDPLTFGLVATGMILVAAGASLVPALSAARADPVEAMRV